MILYLATGNMHKKREMENICEGHTILTPKDNGIDFDPEETGSTFIENALIKAKALWDIVQKPVLADDSGICVEAINDAPGIYSARYEGRDFPKGRLDNRSSISQEEKNALLIDHVNSALEGKKIQNRRCYYVCAMVLYYGHNSFACVQDTMEGELVSSMDEAYGEGGFGYDPIVFLNEYNKTVAALSDREKNEISHRGKATRKIVKLLDSIML